MPIKQLLAKNQVLFLSAIFSLALSLARLVYLQNVAYLFLVWNLFLAFIPFFISEFVLLKKGRPLFTVSLATVCIAFLPNAPYMLTDLFHLRFHSGPGIWYDTLLISSYAWVGLMLFFKTLQNLNCRVENTLQPLLRLALLLGLIFMCAFGIYLGRYLRFNSWDVLGSPVYLFREIFRHFIHPLGHARAWGMTLSYGVFLSLAYFSFCPPRRVLFFSKDS